MTFIFSFSEYQTVCTKTNRKKVTKTKQSLSDFLAAMVIYHTKRMNDEGLLWFIAFISLCVMQPFVNT